MTTRARTAVLGALASSAIGVLVFVGQASASTLTVDGGVIQHWELPAQLDVPEPANEVVGPAEEVLDPPEDTPDPTGETESNPATGDGG